MKLISWPTSPFARKVRVVLLELGISAEIVVDHPLEQGSKVVDHNPLGKIPALVIRRDRALVDSPVICAYLDTLHEGPKLHPSGEALWGVLQLQALGDGIMDAAVLRRLEISRPKTERSAHWLARYEAAIQHTLGRLELCVSNDLNIGTITVACALGYVDFRYSEFNWREKHPKLATWFAQWETRPTMVATAPPRRPLRPT